MYLEKIYQKEDIDMGEIFDVIDHFWEISTNKVISIDLIILCVLGLAYWHIKIIRHPRYRIRILFVVTLIMVNIDLFLCNKLNFGIRHIFYYLIELMIITYVVLSVNSPVLTFFPLKRLNNLVKGGFVKKSKLYFCIMKYVSLTTASKIEYKLLLSNYYINRHLYINAYDELYRFNQRRLFDFEKNNIETYLAYYSVLLGNIRLAKTHIERINEKNPLSILVEMISCDISGGKSEEVLGYIDEAERIIQPKTPNGIKAQIYANYGNCRMIQGNYEDALFNVKTALKFAKKSKNETIILNIYEQLITLICYNNPNDESTHKYFKDYLNQLNLHRPSIYIRSYNFISLYFRLLNKESALLPLIAKGYSSMIINLKGLERYNWEVSNLEVAQNAGVHIKNIMHDVEQDFLDYYNVKMPDRFYLFKKLYGVLDCFFANNITTSQYKNYQKIFKDCESYIAKKAYNDLKEYYDKLDLIQIYDRCEILYSMVSVSAMREWNNKICVNRYDKLIGDAYYYEKSDLVENKSEHKKRVQILEDIADIYKNSGLKPSCVDSYIKIVEECYSVYWLSNGSRYEINVIDEKNMKKYIKIAIDQMKELDSPKRFQSHYIKIAAQLCVLQEFNDAKEYFDLFDKKELKKMNMHMANYFRFVKDKLSSMECNTNVILG